MHDVMYMRIKGSPLAWGERIEISRLITLTVRKCLPSHEGSGLKLQVSVSANSEVYEKMKRDPLMCEALRELMKDEIQEEKDEAVKTATDKTRLDSIRSLMKKMKMTAEQAMDALSISAADQKRYSTML